VRPVVAVLQPQASAVPGRDGAGDRQPKAGAPGLPRPRCVGAVEPVEDAVAVLGRHTGAVAWIVQQNTHVAVPYGQLGHVVRTFEWSRLEKRVISTKLYGRGLGIVREQDVAGGSEVFELVWVRHR
jgi:hypothetical protein